jgi:hypothetical protein
VFLGIVNAIRAYGQTLYCPPDMNVGWQFNLIADSTLFRPVCYALNRCPFKASFDRSCTIRERVDSFAAHGVSSDRWQSGDAVAGIRGIDPAEWLLNPAAARKTSGGGGHD